MDWIGPLRNLTDRRFREVRRHANPAETVTASVTLSGREPIVTCGRYRFVLRGPDGIAEAHEVVDFAAFGLAVLSMSANIEIHLDGPISEPTAHAIDNMAHAFAPCGMPRVAPLRPRPNTIVAAPPAPDTNHKLPCMSGGIDSTASGVTDGRAQGFTHALLIAGADYASAETSGYLGLRERVQRICAPLDLSLVEVETDIRRLPFLRGMLHGLNLIMCLHFVAPRFAAGAFACDNTPAQDLASTPGATTAPFPALPASRTSRSRASAARLTGSKNSRPSRRSIPTSSACSGSAGKTSTSAAPAANARNACKLGSTSSAPTSTKAPPFPPTARSRHCSTASPSRARPRSSAAPASAPRSSPATSPPDALTDALKPFEHKVHRETLRHAPYK